MNSIVIVTSKMSARRLWSRVRQTLPLFGSVCGLLLLLCVPLSSEAQTPIFESTISAKPAITQPANAFVKIYAMPRADNWQYGFRSGGTMAQADWENVFNHVGHLYPLFDVNPFYTGSWANGTYLSFLG